MTWPATANLLLLKGTEAPWAIKWAPGNMPRKPMSWEDWSAKVEVDGDRHYKQMSAEESALRREYEDIICQKCPAKHVLAAAVDCRCPRLTIVDACG